MPEKEKKPKKEPTPEMPPLTQPHDDPKTVWDMVNEYGTYNIQPTSDTNETYPAIAAGNPFKERDHW